MAPLVYGYNDNGVYGAYGTTSTTINIGWGQTVASSATVRWSSESVYPAVREAVFAPTKAELSRAAMRKFLVSLRPVDLFVPPPVLRAPVPVLHQMVHRRRCQSLGPRRSPRFSRA